jgi:16S rRNA (guanine527-N7)-methyltransferase
VDSSRIAALLSPFLNTPGHSEESGDKEPALPSLTQHQLDQISTYLDLLLRWNARINLTALRDAEHIVTRHFGESLFAARCLFANPHSLAALPIAPFQAWAPTEHPHLIDVGSGPGFPGLPIKIWAPQLRLTLIESNQKKVAFLREVTRALTLTDINVFSGRAENYLANSPGQRVPLSTDSHAASVSPELSSDSRADIVTLRAVERFDTMLPIAASLVGPGGILCLLIAEGQLSSTHSLPDVSWLDPIKTPRSDARIVLPGTKTHNR